MVNVIKIQLVFCINGCMEMHLCLYCLFQEIENKFQSNEIIFWAQRTIYIIIEQEKYV
jgi:hypothetical protein